jgi:hypothetical protein
MKRTVIGFQIVLLLFAAMTPPAAAEVLEVPAQPVTAFFPGEQLNFVLKWGGIPAGDSTMAIVESRSAEGKMIYKMVSTAKSRSLVDVVYKVRNRYETHIDPETSLTHKFVFKQHEGGKKKDRILVFDQEARSVTRIVREKGQTQRRDYEIAENSHDTMSALFGLRNVDLEVGKSMKFNVFEGKKNWELIVDVLAEEEIKVRAGTFKTFKLHPKLKFEGIFRRKGELHVWVTADRWRMPVLMRSKVKIGSIDTELDSYVLGRDPAAGEAGEEEPVPAGDPGN